MKIWLTESGEVVRTLSGHTKEVYSVSFSPDGKYVVSGSGDYSVKIWDIYKGITLKASPAITQSPAITPSPANPTGSADPAITTGPPSTAGSPSRTDTFFIKNNEAF